MVKQTLDVMGKKVEVEYEWLETSIPDVTPLKVHIVSDLEGVLGSASDEKAEALLEAVKNQIALPQLRRADA